MLVSKYLVISQIALCYCFLIHSIVVREHTLHDLNSLKFIETFLCPILVNFPCAYENNTHSALLHGVFYKCQLHQDA